MSALAVRVGKQVLSPTNSDEVIFGLSTFVIGNEKRIYAVDSGYVREKVDITVRGLVT